MFLNYGTIFCAFAFYFSEVAGRPGLLDHRGFSNTTSTSSTVVLSLSITTAQTGFTLSSVNPVLSSSTTSTSSIPDRILIKSHTTPSNTVTTTSAPSTTTSLTSRTGSSSLTKSLSSSTTSSSTHSFSTTSGRNSSTSSHAPSTSSFITTSTIKSIPSTTKTANIISNSNATTTACHPVTQSNARGSQCISYCAQTTSFAFAPNTTETVTQVMTLYGNMTAKPPIFVVPPPQTLPLQPCTLHIVENTITSARATSAKTGVLTQITDGRPMLTVMYVTSKTTVTNFVTVPTPVFGGDTIQIKKTTNPLLHTFRESSTAGPAVSPIEPTVIQTSVPPATNDPVAPQTNAPGQPQGPIQTPSKPTPTAIVNGISVILPGSTVIIDSTTLVPSSGATTTVMAAGQVFTINPSEVLAAGTTIARPTPAGPAGASAAAAAAITPGLPLPTVLNGITIAALDSTLAVIDHSTYTIGVGATPTTVIIHDQTLSIGPNGIGTPSTTIFQPGDGSYPTSPPVTHIATLGALTLTEIGDSTLLAGSQTFVLSAGAQPTTVVIDGQTLSIGPNGVGVGSGGASTTVFQPSLSSGGGGVAGPGPTQVITAGGITFSEIGSSLVVIGSKTFTVGAVPTTDVFNGVTISIGASGGVGFAAAGTTVRLPSSVAAAPTPTTSTTATGAQFVSSSSSTSNSGTTVGGRRGLHTMQCVMMSVLIGIWVLL